MVIVPFFANSTTFGFKKPFGAFSPLGELKYFLPKLKHEIINKIIKHFKCSPMHLNAQEKFSLDLHLAKKDFISRM